MEINDILGIGKILPIDKLIEIISSSVGKISKPYFDKKDVDTKVYEIEKLAEARAKEMKIISTAVRDNYLLTGGIKYDKDKLIISSPNELTNFDKNMLITPSLENRTQDRVSFQEHKKQLNIENVTAFAAEELKNENPITDEPIDEDWTSRFFRIVEDVSDDDMQAVWGKILAGEIKQPKTYSLRTLELLRNITKKDATIFEKVANIAIKSNNKYYLFYGNDNEYLTREFDVSYMDIALLTEIGLIQPGTFINHYITQQSVDFQSVMLAGQFVIIIKIKANTPTIAMPVDVFTTAGNELMNFINPQPPLNYLTYLANSIKNENVHVQYSNIISNNGDSVKHTLPLQDL